MTKNAIFRTVAMMAALAVPCISLRAAEEPRERTVNLPEGLLDKIDPAKTITEMSGIPSRLTGTPGCRQALDSIRQKFEEIGLDNVQEHSFSVVVPVDRGGSLTVGTQTYEIHGVWPNHARAPKTVSEGVPGRLAYAGNGEVAKLNGLEPEGSVVLMDFNCGARWLNPAQFGAVAIVFIEPYQTDRKQAEDKFLQIPASIPRYYIKRAELARMLSDILEEQVGEAGLPQALEKLNRRGTVDVLVKADILWDSLTGQNLSLIHI